MGDIVSLVNGLTNRASDNKEMAEKLRHLATFVEKCQQPIHMGVLLLAVDGYVSRYPFGSHFNKGETIGIMSIATHDALHDKNYDGLELISD